ncbi:MAG: helix-turn-helix domain-containing protein [Mesorhizobium sp.]|nr:MAG: helix-turn-helix domain-containing protein [Mesorhizobium sp.]
MKVNSALQYVTELFANGKRAELARLLGVSRSTVTGWDNLERRPDGMGGTIPAAYVPKLLKIAAERAITLDLSKLFPD